ncbi:hypothetical protein [Nocardioides sp.]|uniref:hypothetical protein n=1 Tax=Nocardioides sp. TaxID=35761 RepID=UPI0031FF2040|nr:hypothetical protein [Nocardioides sp.]
MQSTDHAELFARVQARFGSGSRHFSDAALTEVRLVGDEAVFVFRWAQDRHVFGVPISLTDVDKSYFYEQPVTSIDEWLDELTLGLMVQLDVGFVARASRARVGEYIELRAPTWPMDDRFFDQIITPAEPPIAWGCVPSVAAAGLDTEPALTERDVGRLVAWITAYENNSTGGPFVGTACVSRVDEDTATLVHLEAVPDAPPTVVLELARLAVYEAACTGALRVVTEMPHAELDVLGFRETPGGAREVHTDLLDASPDLAAALLARSQHGEWGRDRDEGGRHIPEGSVGRWLHRLRHGRSGAKPVRYAG